MYKLPTMKRILFLGDAGSSHLTKWVLALHGKYCEVGVFSLREPASEIKNLEGLKIHVHQTDKNKFSASLVSKFSYLFAVPELKKFTAEFKPDIIHAHYASSYGLMGARLGKHPLVISAWGSDVYAFGDNILGKSILKYNFKKADVILSTSDVMKGRVSEFTDKEISVTPFGVDTNRFSPQRIEPVFFPANSFVFGMVKSMEQIYGVDLLIRAFAELVHKGHESIRLLLVGSGTKMDEYQNLSREIGVETLVHFAGRINHLEIPNYNRMIDVFVNPSHAESFGVSVLEAMSCATPVIVTEVGGLAEIVENNKTGMYVRSNDVNDLANKMEYLLMNESVRNSLGANARLLVMEKYSWKRSVEIMEEVYSKII